ARITLNADDVTQLGWVGFRAAVPGSSIRTGKIDWEASDVAWRPSSANHMHRTIRQLLHIHVIHIDKLTVGDNVVAVVEAEEVGGRDTVDLVKRSVRSVPSSVEHSPPCGLFQRPRSVDVLLKTRGQRCKHRRTDIRYPVQCVLLPIARIEC